jgi:tetratricopeptide (TPR) repeat protein
VDQFLDTLGRWQTLDQLQAAANGVHACLRTSTPDELTAQLRRFPEDLAGANLIEVGCAALCCGAMVEHGGDPDVCGPVLLDRTEDLLKDMAAFWDEVRSRSGATLTPRNATSLGERHFNEVLQANQRAAWAFVAYKPLLLGIVTHLSRSKALRAAARGRPQLLAMAPAVDMPFSEHSHLGCLLRVLDNEPLIVLHPGAGKGYRVRMTGVADVLQLDTLLAARLVGDPAAGLPGRAPDPAIVSAVTAGPVRPDLEAEGVFNLWAWGGLRRDGTLPPEPGPDAGHLLPWYAFPDQIPTFEGVRVVLLGPRNPPAHWPGTRRYREMPGELTVQRALTPEEVQEWLARIAKAAPAPAPAFVPPGQDSTGDRQERPAARAPVDLNAELAATQVAVHEGRWREAIEHLVPVVTAAPIHPAVTAVLDTLVAGAPDPVGLIPTDRPMDFGTAAILTRALGKASRVVEAYQVLRQLAQASPGCGIIDWALPWLEGEGLAEDARDDAALRFIVSAHHRFSNQNQLHPDQAALVHRWLPHVRRLLARRPVEDQLQSAFCILLRQAGQLDEAVELARARHAKAPCYESAVSVAANLRAKQDFAAWYEAVGEIFKFSPDDVPTRLDLGDCFWEEQQKLDEADRWYEDALRLAPNHPWAQPSLLAVRYLRTNDPAWRNQLEDYVEGNPQNERGRVALGRITPFFTSILYPADATVNLMNEMADKLEAAAEGEASGRIRLVTNGLEAPSCRRSIDRQVELWGGKVSIEREIRGMQSPDPRQPRVPVRYRLWEYDGQTPRPAVAPPPAQVAEAVTAIAATSYDLGSWSGYAANVAARLGPDSLDGLLGVMAHPPAPPARVRMWYWTLRVQTAAALVISQMGRDWHGSVRRQVLFDLANGPMDWSIVAAAVALTAVALREPNVAPEVGQLFTEVRRDLPRSGVDWYEGVLLNLHLSLPGLPADRRKELRAEREELEARSAKRMTDAQLAARLFLERPIPEGWDRQDLGRNMIELYARQLMLDHPAFPTMLEGALQIAQASVAEVSGEAKAYLEEQMAVLRLIRGEMEKAAPAPDVVDGRASPSSEGDWSRRKS